MLSQRVESIIQSISSLRPMPANVSRILNEVEKRDISIDGLVGLIGLDQALTALVLQMSNSVSLGYSRTCTTLNEAIMLIGLGRLKTILLTSSATGMMKRSLSGYRQGAGELWHHSLVVGVASEWLAQVLRYPNPEEAYVSGLLHDIGKLLLDQVVLSDYNTIVDAVQKYKIPLWQVEEKMIGIDHAKVGGLIAEHWNFPVVLVDAIRCHHAPSFARTNQQLPAIVNVANSLAQDYQFTESALLSFEIHPESLNILKIDAAEVEKLKLKMKNSGKFPDLSKTG
ncbi:MAG: HDOD domain-containing protein [Anaerolineales bacterium]|nr:HDOD domain-containing protein [Anaerolineales bacterium]